MQGQCLGTQVPNAPNFILFINAFTSLFLLKYFSGCHITNGFKIETIELPFIPY